MRQRTRLTAALLSILLLTGCMRTGEQPQETPSAAPTPAPVPTQAPEPIPTPTPEPTPEIEYELWYGQVPHIFTHCLIAYPELYANGYSLREYHDVLAPLFDTNKVIDLANRP